MSMKTTSPDIGAAIQATLSTTVGIVWVILTIILAGIVHSALFYLLFLAWQTYQRKTSKVQPDTNESAEATYIGFAMLVFIGTLSVALSMQEMPYWLALRCVMLGFWVAAALLAFALLLIFLTIVLIYTLITLAVGNGKKKEDSPKFEVLVREEAVEPVEGGKSEGKSRTGEKTA